MPGTPRTKLDDTYTGNLTCAICGQPTLSVAHVPNLPDYVACSNCGAAFVVEDGGERVLYGKIPAEYPATRKFALRQWAWIEAVARRAGSERPPAQATTAQVPPEPAAEPGPGQTAADRPMSRPTVPVSRTGHEPEAGPGPGSQPLPAQVDAEASPKPFAPGPPPPEAVETSDEAAVRARILQASEDDEPLAAVPYLPGSGASPSRPTPPAPTPSTPRPAGHPLPIGKPVASAGLPQVPAFAGPPTPAAGLHAPRPMTSPPPAAAPSPAPAAPAVPVAQPAPVAPEAPAAPTDLVLRPEDPPPGMRYRVTLTGRQVVMPSAACAHCMRTPVRGQFTVMARLGRSGRSSRRRTVRVNVPLCEDCRRRASDRGPEERSARLQGTLISAVVGLGAVLAGLALGLVDLGAEPVTGVLTLLLLGFIGYALPALFFLLGRSSRPPTEDAHYVRSTLIIPSDQEGLSTPFEWRNQGYAGLFSEANTSNVVGNVVPIRSES